MRVDSHVEDEGNYFCFTIKNGEHDVATFGVKGLEERDKWKVKIQEVCDWLDYSMTDPFKDARMGEKDINKFVFKPGLKVLGTKSEDRNNSWKRCRQFYFCGLLVLGFYILILFAGQISRIVFTALILWRGLHLNVDFLEKLRRMLDVLSFAFKIPLLTYILYPFVAFITVLSNINIDFSSVNVTCTGAQAPLELIVLCSILIFTVIIIESKFSILQKVYFKCINLRFVIAGITYKLKYDADMAAVGAIHEYLKASISDKGMMAKLMNWLGLALILEKLGLFEDDRSRVSKEEVMTKLMEIKVDFKPSDDCGTDKNNAMVSAEHKVFDEECQLSIKVIKKIVEERKLGVDLGNVDEHFPEVFKKKLYMSKWTKYGYLILCGLSGVMAALDPLQRVLMYMMGFAPLSPFVAKYGIVHDSSSACDALDGIPYIDTVIADLTSTLLWLIFLPAVYTISRVLVPGHYHEALVKASWEEGSNELTVDETVYVDEGAKGFIFGDKDYLNGKKASLRMGQTLAGNGIKVGTVIVGVGPVSPLGNRSYTLSETQNSAGSGVFVRVLRVGAQCIAYWEKGSKKLYIRSVLKGSIHEGQSISAEGLRPGTIIVRKGRIENDMQVYYMNQEQLTEVSASIVKAMSLPSDVELYKPMEYVNPMFKHHDDEYSDGVPSMAASGSGLEMNDLSKRAEGGGRSINVDGSSPSHDNDEERMPEEDPPRLSMIGSEDRKSLVVDGKVILSYDIKSVDFEGSVDGEKHTPTNAYVMKEGNQGEIYYENLLSEGRETETKKKAKCFKRSYIYKVFSYVAVDLYISFAFNNFVQNFNEVLDKDYVGRRKRNNREQLLHYSIADLKGMDDYFSEYPSMEREEDDVMEMDNTKAFREILVGRVLKRKHLPVLWAPFADTNKQENSRWKSKKAEHADNNIPSFKALSSDVQKELNKKFGIDTNDAQFTAKLKGDKMYISHIEYGAPMVGHVLYGKGIVKGTKIVEKRSINEIRPLRYPDGHEEEVKLEYITCVLSKPQPPMEGIIKLKASGSRWAQIKRTLTFIGAYTGVAHFATIRGRERWFRAIEKYYMFILVSFGYWNDKSYDSFEFDRDEYSLKDIKIDAQMDPRTSFAYLISAVICTRAVLLQVVPALTFFSMYAISISLSPIWVVSSRALERLPHLWVTNAIQVAKERESEGRDFRPGDMTPRDRRVYWSILLNALVIFVADSRAILYFYSTFFVIVASMIVYDDPEFWTWLALVILIPYLGIRSLEVLVYIGRYFQVNDDDLCLEALERSYNRWYPWFKRCIMKPIKSHLQLISKALNKLFLKMVECVKNCINSLFRFCVRLPSRLGRD